MTELVDNEGKIDISDEDMERIGEGLADLFCTFINSAKSWDQVKIKYEAILENSDHYAGKIVHYHLVLTDLINNTLVSLNLCSEGKAKDLPFKKKIDRLPREGKVFCCLIPGLEELNDIRNEVAHELLKKPQTDEIDTYVSFFKMGDPLTLSLEERIEKFTFLAIILFSVNSLEVKSHWDQFFQKHPAFFEELKSEKFTPWVDKFLKR
ncbi:MAG: hypothetical protein V4635_09440 [Bacteroidota bacterium]